MADKKKRPPVRATLTMWGITDQGKEFKLKKEVVFKRARIKKADHNKRAA